MFERVIAGIDQSEAAGPAARAAARVADPDGQLVLVAVDDPSPAVHAGWGMARILEQLREETAAALDRGRGEAERIHEVETRLVKGDPFGALLAEIERLAATLVVVGTHERSRAGGIALGAVSTRLLHEAPCPVLVARGEVDAERWPRSIVVGIDGSDDSATALAAARDLGRRLDVPVRVVVATEGDADLERARELAPELETHDGRALDVLNVASETADLVVAGSRGRRGLRALGSVSERLAHEARSSVLVVRSR